MSKELVSSTEIFELAQRIYLLKNELAELNESLKQRKNNLMNLWQDAKGDEFFEIITQIDTLNQEADQVLYSQIEQLQQYYANLVKAENLQM